MESGPRMVQASSPRIHWRRLEQRRRAPSGHHQQAACQQMTQHRLDMCSVIFNHDDGKPTRHFSLPGLDLEHFKKEEVGIDADQISLATSATSTMPSLWIFLPNALQRWRLQLAPQVLSSRHKMTKISIIKIRLCSSTTPQLKGAPCD
jgi:hypothetical protein